MNYGDTILKFPSEQFDRHIRARVKYCVPVIPPEMNGAAVANRQGAPGRSRGLTFQDGGHLNPGTRKAVGMAILLAALAVYVAVIVIIADFVPDHWAAELLFFAVAGVAWALPLRGVLRWLNRADDKGPDGA